MNGRIQAVMAGGMLATLMAFSGAATAQATDAAAGWPARPVTIVTPFAPGASVDMEGRILSNELSRNFGQQFVMDFKPGGTMAVGMTYASRQKPDGYTLVWVSSAYALLPLVVKDGSYDPVKDFDPVSLINKKYAILSIPNTLPVKDMKEFVAYAKANPGAINFGTGGAGGVQHLLGLMLEAATGTKYTFVHYKAVGASYPDLIAGRTHIVPVTFASALPMIKAGKLRGMAVSATERNSLLPDVPTALEQGVNWEYSSWLGMIAPARTPTAIVNRVQAELAKIVRTPDVVKRFGEEYTLIGSTPAEFRKHHTAETERWKRLVTEHNISISAN